MPPGLQVNGIPGAGVRLTEGQSVMTGTSAREIGEIGFFWNK